MRIQVDSVWRLAVLILVSLMLPTFSSGAEQQRGNETYLCSEPNPADMCSPSNTCGSASVPCTVGIKRTADSAEVTPGIPGVKTNAPFCVKSGTTVTWKSISKNTGFLVDLGPASPFQPDGAIIGGSDRSVSVVAKKEGCFKYSTGACVSGSIYGMCRSVDTEIIVTGGHD